MRARRRERPGFEARFTNDAKNLPATFVGPVTFVFTGVGVRLLPHERLRRGVSTFYVYGDRIRKHFSARNVRIKIAVSHFSSVRPPRTKAAISPKWNGLSAPNFERARLRDKQRGIRGNLEKFFGRLIYTAFWRGRNHALTG